MFSKAYLETHARRLDLYLYECLFEKADRRRVLDELGAYQNNDGGFGKALEPDLRLPDSSALATTVALQYLAKVGMPADSLTEKAVRYLVATYDDDKQQWVDIPPAADMHPRAPWWNYAEVLKWAGWGNPSAEVLGYLLENADIVNDQPFLDKIGAQAVRRLDAINEPEQHEVKCYIRLYERAGRELQAKLHDKLAAHITQLTVIDPKDWEGYLATPLTFVDSPDSPFAYLFSKQLLLDNAHFVKSKLLNGDHWEPTWEWGQFAHEWAQARKDWSGKLTVDNLLLLQAFGVGAD
ncbi:MAG TPA: hypothetical protein VLF91_05080 [Candidatus Saccharimonadales bacterium]|nr:hypothetical protein [Candidatus Saccharimonadales bacterium]